MALAKLGPEYAKNLEIRRAESVKQLVTFIGLAELCLSHGGQITFE